jgi:predicted transcriptional regulator
MQYELLGFLKANKNRVRVLEMLSTVPASKRNIAHKLRMPGLAVEKTLEELLEKGLIATSFTEKKGGYKATEKGKKLLRSMTR